MSFINTVLCRIAGAAVALGGAAGARLVSESFQVEERALIWVAGTVAIFAGLYLICLPTLKRIRDKEEAETPAEPEPPAGPDRQ